MEKRDGTTDGQRRGKHLSAATNKHETIDEPLEEVFFSVGVEAIERGPTEKN
jgi:hypothetical protein